jgi:uncharacterized protein (TIGR03437 family)
MLLCMTSAYCEVNVLTYHNDLARTGQNLNETILTLSNVRPGVFGQVFKQAVDGQVYAQPLYMWGLNIPGKGIHNVVFVVTEHDSVYAFDADSNTGPNATPLWNVSFINPVIGVRTAPSESLECTVIAPEIGITGTPVIDPSTGTLYVVAMTLEDFGHTYVQRLHALDVTTGAERPGSPVQIEASAPGTADGNTFVTFKPRWHKQRAGLLLLNGAVYTTWSSHCDSGPYHGWVIGYDAATLQQVAVYTTTPNSQQAGSIWQSGAAPAADADGNIYIVTANGTFDADRGGADMSQSIIKLSTSNGLSVADYFTPFNADSLSGQDLDLGSSGPLLLPDVAGASALSHLLVTGSKEGRLYVVDRDNMGHFQAGSDSQIIQSLPSAGGAVFGIPVYFNNTVYFAARDDAIKAFSLVNGLLSQQPISQSVGPYPYLGSVPSISANGSTDSILWTVDSSVELHAYDAMNLANELYKGSTGSYIKFATPTIANGKVYVGIEDSLVVFGLLNAPDISAIVNAAGFQPGSLAPGSIVSVFGANLADRTETASENPLPTRLASTQLLINGLPAPLYYAGPHQINAQIPFKSALGQATAVVKSENGSSAPVKLVIQQAAPGIFTPILDQDGSVNGPDHAAPVGSTLHVFVTGLGPTDSSVASGINALSDPPVQATLTVTATIGGRASEVLFAGLAPGLVGVYELNLRVPLQPPGAYPLIVKAGGVASNITIVTVGGGSHHWLSSFARSRRENGRQHSPE